MAFGGEKKKKKKGKIRKQRKKAVFMFKLLVLIYADVYYM